VVQRNTEHKQNNQGYGELPRLGRGAPEDGGNRSDQRRNENGVGTTNPIQQRNNGKAGERAAGKIRGIKSRDAR